MTNELIAAERKLRKKRKEIDTAAGLYEKNSDSKNRKRDKPLRKGFQGALTTKNKNPQRPNNAVKKYQVISIIKYFGCLGGDIAL